MSRSLLDWKYFEFNFNSLLFFIPAGSEENSDDEGDEDDDEDYENSEDDEEAEADGNDYPISNGASKPGFDSGCTAVVAVLRDNKKLYVANAGKRFIIFTNFKDF